MPLRLRLPAAAAAWAAAVALLLLPQATLQQSTCSPPAPPSGALKPAAKLINAGGPAMCGMAADQPPGSVLATDGTAESWVYPHIPACAACASAPTADCVACSVRVGRDFFYDLPTKPGHSYTLRLTFSEVYWAEAERRLFDVLVDGVVLLPGVDPFALAKGRFVPVVSRVQFVAEVNVTRVALVATRDNAILSALELFDMGLAAEKVLKANPDINCAPPTLPSGTRAAKLRVNAGGPSLCGLSADAGAAALAVGGAEESWVNAHNYDCAHCASGPRLSCAACSVRVGNSFYYDVGGLSPGRRYTLRFTFSEVYWGEKGRRSFDVLVDGRSVLTAVDPFALANGEKFVPAQKEVAVTATATAMRVQLVAAIDNAILSALEVYE